MNNNSEASRGIPLRRGILTIGIPVFEEAAGLANSISSIEQLAEFKSGLIEVVIWDNASGDQSFQVAVEFASRFRDFVRVGKNESNLGGVENLRQVFKNASSQFVWIIGAGEVLMPSSLLPLIQFLGGPHSAKLLMGTVSAGKASTALSDSWEIKTISPCLRSCFIETISLSIVKRSLALKVLDGEEREVKDEFHVWPHLEFALVATTGFTFQVTSPNLVEVSENPTGWWYHGDRAVGTYLNQVKLLRAYPTEVAWVKERLNNRAGWHFAKFAFEVKVEGSGITFEDLVEAMRSGVHFGPILVSLAIVLSPLPLLRLVQSIFRQIRRR